MHKCWNVVDRPIRVHPSLELRYQRLPPAGILKKKLLAMVNIASIASIFIYNKTANINVKKLKVSLDCKPYETGNHTYKKANIIVVSLIFFGPHLLWAVH